MIESNEENHTHVFIGNCFGISEELKAFNEKSKSLLLESLEKIIWQLTREQSINIDTLVLFALLKKGYRFENDKEARDFIKSKGTREVNTEFLTETFCVDHIPFLKVYFQYKIEDLNTEAKKAIIIKYEFL